MARSPRSTREPCPGALRQAAGLAKRTRLHGYPLCCRNHLAAFRVISETDLVLTMPRRYAARLNVGFGNRILPLPRGTDARSLPLWHAAVDKDRPIAGCAGW